MTSYLLLSLVLENPSRGVHIDTPANPQEWKRFFGMMDTLERNEIAVFQNGRYLLHPKRKADVVAKAEQVLDEAKKSLADEPTVAENATVQIVVENNHVSPEFNVCPTCKGKGRVNIEDVLVFFGNFLCLTCNGNKQIPVPPRSTFPPVDLSKKPNLPNALLSSDSKIAPVPQALEVGSVRVIVEAPVPTITEKPAPTDEEIEAFLEEKGLSPIEVLAAAMVGKSVEPITSMGDGGFVWHDKLVPADCPSCEGSGMLFDGISEAPYIRVKTCSECGGNGEMQERPMSDSFVPVLSPFEQAITEQFPETLSAEYVPNSPVDEKTVIEGQSPKQYVRINTTGRGFSSGGYELIREEERYGRKWMLVKFTTDKGLPHYFPAEICERFAPKTISPVIVSKPSILAGLPIAQAIAEHGVEETKAALNEVARRVVGQVLISDLPELAAVTS